MAWKLQQQDHPQALQVIHSPGHLALVIALQHAVSYEPENLALVIALQHALLCDVQSSVAKVTVCVIAITEPAQHLLHG